MEEHFKAIIQAAGEDPTREGLLKTPARAAKAFRFLTDGYQQDINELLNGAVFTENYKNMIIVKDIEFYSLCEHHLLPFFGKAHVAYIPNGKIIGLSKIARIVDMYARRLQVQERLTDQIANALKSAIKPAGVAVMIEAQHLCMMARGVQKQDSSMITSSVSGEFHEDEKTRMELFEVLNVSRGGK
ncbi:MAG: GTP cyclohydrolase I FolE [Armatimonadota bacterium]